MKDLILVGSSILLVLGWVLEPAFAEDAVIKLRSTDFRDPLKVELDAKLTAHPNDDGSLLLNINLFEGLQSIGITLGLNEIHGTRSVHSVDFTLLDQGNFTLLTIAPKVEIKPGKAEPPLYVAATTVARANGQTASALAGMFEVALGKSTKLSKQENTQFGTKLIPDLQSPISFYDINIDVNQIDNTLNPLVNLGQNNGVYTFSFSAPEEEIKSRILSAFVFDSLSQQYEVLQDTPLFTASFQANTSLRSTSFSTFVGGGTDGFEVPRKVPLPPQAWGTIAAFGLGSVMMGMKKLKKGKKVSPWQDFVTKKG
jgi:hypothetical protein